MSPVQFIEKNIISELLKQGFDNEAANIGARDGVTHYGRASAAGKGKMFDECLKIAKATASKYQVKKKK